MYSVKKLIKLDPQGISVIDNSGEAKWLPAPFSACCLEDVGLLKANSLVYVQEVATNARNELIYVVGRYGYHYSYFAVDSSY